MVVVAALVLAAASGCSFSDRSDGGGPADAPAPAWAPIPMAGGPAGVGAQLGNGFSVPEAAFLVGGPLALGVQGTYNGEPLVDAGWEAYLEVPGDPRLVVDEVRRQAEAAGLPLHPMATGDRDPIAFCGPASDGYSCLAAAAADRGDDDHRRLDVSFVRTAGAGARAPQSHLRIRYSDRERPFDPLGRLGPIDAPLGPRPDPVASAWPPLATTGESFGAGYGDGIAGFTVEAGSRLLAPVTSEPFDGCTNNAYVAVLAVDGEPDDVLAAYATQVANHVGDEPPNSTGDPLRVANGSLVTVVSAGAPGGDSYGLRLIEPASGTPLLHITTCYD